VSDSHAEELSRMRQFHSVLTERVTDLSAQLSEAKNDCTDHEAEARVYVAEHLGKIVLEASVEYRQSQVDGLKDQVAVAYQEDRWQDVADLSQQIAQLLSQIENPITTEIKPKDEKVVNELEVSEEEPIKDSTTIIVTSSVPLLGSNEYRKSWVKETPKPADVFTQIPVSEDPSDISSSLELVTGLGSRVKDIQTAGSILAEGKNQELSQTVLISMQKIEAVVGKSAYLLAELSAEELQGLSTFLQEMENPSKRRERLMDMVQEIRKIYGSKMDPTVDYVVKKYSRLSEEELGEAGMRHATEEKLAKIVREKLGKRLEYGTDIYGGHGHTVSAQENPTVCLLADLYIRDNAIERQYVRPAEVASLINIALQTINATCRSQRSSLKDIVGEDIARAVNWRRNKLGELTKDWHTAKRGGMTFRQAEWALQLMIEIQSMAPFSIFGNQESIKALESSYSSN